MGGSRGRGQQNSTFRGGGRSRDMPPAWADFLFVCRLDFCLLSLGYLKINSLHVSRGDFSKSLYSKKNVDRRLMGLNTLVQVCALSSCSVLEEAPANMTLSRTWRDTQRA